MDHVGGEVPDVLSVVDDADHAVTAGEEGGQVGGLRARVETLVTGQDSVAEQLRLRVEDPEGEDGGL